MTAKDTQTNENLITPFKIIGLIGTVVMVMAVFVGAVMWIATNMSDAMSRIHSIERNQARYEGLVEKNTSLLQQHDKLLGILSRHSEQIKTLTEFMAQGNRFTAEDGRQLRKDVEAVEKQMYQYKILNNELDWIKKQLQKIDETLNRRDAFLQRKLEELNNEVKARNPDRQQEEYTYPYRKVPDYNYAPRDAPEQKEVEKDKKELKKN